MTVQLLKWSSRLGLIIALGIVSTLHYNSVATSAAANTAPSSPPALSIF